MSTDKATKQAWFALWILFGINLMNFYDRQIMGALAETIRKEWSLSDTMLGTLGTAFILMYAAVGLPLGRLADTWSRRKILSIGVSIWSVLTAASGLAPNFAWLFATRLGVGIGEASCAPAANSLIGDLFPPRRRALALSIFMLGLPIGTFLCYSLSGLIASAYGWRYAFYFACIPGLILGLLALKLPDPARGATEERPMSAQTHSRSPFWLVLGIPTILWIIISGALHNFNMYAVNSFLPAFLMRTHLLGLKEATTVSSIVLGAVGVIGLLGGGWGADRLSRKRADGKLLLSAIATAIAAPCIYFALNQAPGAILPFMLLMGTGIMLMFVYYSGVYAAIQDVIPAALRGTAMAIYFFAMYLLGASFGPVITGMLSDYFAKQAMTVARASAMSEQFKAIGLHHAMYIIPILCAVLALVLFAASRTVAADMEKKKKM
ncbi:spinster family MFS transporter [Haliscomenobacter hydrossis]|uniref:Major facilitator superfamily MFS_1 n=1 Tax=Haliscomenobacter hydrossis (strain ATCC 27775 / DSM 1100 / LMG 10767 / O) TaxID=760192 RepID=F4KUP0_HALH1|nr:MFS transporter [Haliscomenobacter hydrossis]AEE53443.1 major facilitator superfamily MFS_1 [Haliscomenobacter hydrossis DSM 1100]